VTAFDGYRPGDTGRIISLHMDYYAPTWALGAPFEAKLASELGTFLDGFRPDRDALFCARRADGGLDGAIAVSGEGEGRARLRWFIVGADGRGRGLGRDLLDAALGFCRANGFSSVWLTTFAGLDAARTLYERAGFRMVAENDDDQWQGGVREQRYELNLEMEGA